jgi:CDP-diacylglycerol---serine O-phosphatidyltransferase
MRLRRHLSGDEIVKRYLANSLTCLNLLLGFMAIVAASHGNIAAASLLVLVGVVLDMGDGWLARRLNADAHFGRELDSLADVVTFGAAPSLIVYDSLFSDSGLIGIMMSALPLIAAALRLARFNLSGKSNEFCGLPCPAAALLLLCIANWMQGDLLAIAAVVLCAALMVSDLPYPMSVSKRAAVILAVACTALFAVMPYDALSLWVIVFGYAAVGPFRRGGQWVKRLAAPALRLLRALSTPAARTHPPASQT